MIVARVRCEDNGLISGGLRYSAQVQLGFDFTIRPSSSSNCTDGDGTSVSLLDGIARTEVGSDLMVTVRALAIQFSVCCTVRLVRCFRKIAHPSGYHQTAVSIYTEYTPLLQIGAFLSTAAGCVAVDPASDPDPPVVVISAPEVVGCCDDLILEGIASYPSTGEFSTAFSMDP